jgi:hypothetical protein
MYISPSFHFNMKHLGGQALSEVRLNCWGAAKQHMSMVLAFFLELSLHQLSHQSHSCPPLGCCDRSHIELPKKIQKEELCPQDPQISLRNRTNTNNIRRPGGPPEASYG